MRKHRLLFVCLGNICRSPMAQGVFARVAAEAGVADRFVLDSAGTSGWHEGEAPDSRAQAAARGRGVDISAQRARTVTARDLADFDLLLAMDRSNVKALNRLFGASANAQVRLFLDYAPEQPISEVPDPYYGGADGFDRTYDLLEVASRGLLAELLATADGRRRRFKT